MYPVAPACLILFVKRISDRPLLMLPTQSCDCERNNRGDGRFSNQKKSYHVSPISQGLVRDLARGRRPVPLVTAGLLPLCRTSLQESAQFVSS